MTALARGAILLKARDILTANLDALARLVTEENGKPVAEARGEVSFAIQYLPWFAEEARRVYGEIVPPPVAHKRLWVTRQPLGVVAAITPWNFPATMVLRKVSPALAAGCPVVLKPAKETPLTAFEIARAFEEAGPPPGVFNVVVGKRAAPIVDVFLKDPRVRKIAFTGSTEVGKILMAQAAASSSGSHSSWAATRRSLCSMTRISTGPCKTPWPSSTSESAASRVSAQTGSTSSGRLRRRSWNDLSRLCALSESDQDSTRAPRSDH